MRRSARSGRLTSFLLTLLLAHPASAQDDGPRSYGFVPTGVWATGASFVRLESNFNIQQSILVRGLDLDARTYVVSVGHSFELAGRLALVGLAAPFSWMGGNYDPGNGGQPVDLPSLSGALDPVVAFRVGLMGAPATSLAEAASGTGEPAANFRLYGLVGLRIPIGDYDADRITNFGTNRWGLRLATPMTLVLRDNERRSTLEFVPSVMFFEDNTEPAQMGPLGGAERLEQDPTYSFETHYTVDFPGRFWAGGGLFYNYGGQTIADGVPNGNRQNHLSGGLHVGYALTSALGVNTTIGSVLVDGDGADGWLFRIRIGYAL